MNLKNRKLNYKYKILCYILVVTLIPIITLGIYSYRTYITEVMNKIMVSNHTTANQVKNRMDDALINIRKSYIEAVEREEIKWILEEDIWYSDYTELVKAGKTFSGPDYYYDYIEGYTFINYRTKWVLSNRGMFPYDLIQNKEEVDAVYQDNKVPMINNYWMTNFNPAPEPEILKRETINLNNLSLIVKLPQIKKTPYGLLIVNMNMDKIIQVLTQDLGDAGITVMDSFGEVIYTTNEELAKSLSIKQKNENLEQEDNIRDELGNEYVYVLKESDAINWIYAVSYDKALVQRGGDTILSITVLMLGIIILILILAVVFTNSLYSPIVQLSKYVKGISPDKNSETGKNEFDFITRSIDNLVDNNTLLENLIISQKPQLIENFHLRLIRGDIREGQIKDYLGNLSMTMERYYIVMAVNMKLTHGTDIFDEARQDALRIDVIENMPEEILKKLFMPPVSNARTIICSVTAEELWKLEDKVYEIYKEMMEYTQSKYNFSISMGSSTSYEDLKFYGNAYHESISALKDNDIFNIEQDMEQQEIMFYSDIKNKESGFTYERLLEREIKEAVDLGDKEKAYEVVDKFINSLIVQKALHNEISLSLQRFLIAVILAALESGIQANQLYPEELSNIFLRFNQIYDMNKIKSYLKYKIIAPIIDRLEEFRTSKSSEIMSNIQNLIDKTGGDITLVECAQQLNYHPTYIWKVMKLEKNTTFSNYVGEHKLEEAKRLLLETNLTVSEIALKLNYTNSQNFIRFFSKLEGVTPGKYRQENKNKPQ